MSAQHIGRRRPATGSPAAAQATPTTLDDIARALGVSAATVSRALSGKPGVGAELAGRIRDVASDLGYVANSSAQALAAGSSTIVGLLVHQIDNPYFGEMASTIADAADAAGLTLQIGQTARDPARQHRQIRALMAQHARCIIVAGSSYRLPAVEQSSTDALTTYAGNGGRVVAIGHHHVTSDTVRLDEEGAGSSVARHLLELGHRRIAVVSGPPNMTTITERMTGVNGVFGRWPDARVRVVYTDFSGSDSYRATATIMAEQPDTTAIMALSDTMALGALSCLRDLGISVPGQVSVSGVDDIAVASQLAPSLTSVRFPIAEAAREALQLATLPAAEVPRTVRLGHTLIVRASTGPVDGS